MNSRRLPLLIAVALSLLHVGAAYRTLARPADLAAIISLLPAWEFVVAALWAVAFGVLALRLWRRERTARRALGWALIAWIGYSLVRLVLFARADYDLARLPFLSLASIFACALIYIMLVRPTPNHPAASVRTRRAVSSDSPSPSGTPRSGEGVGG